MRYNKSLFFIPLFILTSFFFSPTMNAAASNRSGQLGLGVMFGEPTGFTMKYWTGNRSALNFGLTYSFGNSAVVLVDYQWHFPQAFASAGRDGHLFVPYVGLGGVFAFHRSSRNSDAGIGMRIPLGIEFLPGRPPFGIFLEIVPGMWVAPAVDGFLQGAIGARFYF
jgi:hypothetical protein